ncbi:MAG: DUF167 domain-containing protein [Phycisphaerales bacterium JB052]
MSEQAGSVKLRVKAVPGASRDAIAGMLGDRVKVRTSAAPEGGKANKAIIKLLAKSLGIKPTQVTLVSGQTNPEKMFTISALDANQISDALGFDASDALG